MGGGGGGAFLRERRRCRRRRSEPRYSRQGGSGEKAFLAMGGFAGDSEGLSTVTLVEARPTTDGERPTRRADALGTRAPPWTTTRTSSTRATRRCARPSVRARARPDVDTVWTSGPPRAPRTRGLPPPLSHQHRPAHPCVHPRLRAPPALQVNPKDVVFEGYLRIRASKGIPGLKPWLNRCVARETAARASSTRPVAARAARGGGGALAGWV